MFKKYELGLSSNIFTTVMPNGSFYPEHVGIEDERPDQFIAAFDAHRDKPWDQCVFLDLGCGEGSSSVAIGKTGARVIAIDGREDIIKRAEFTRDQLGYSNVRFHTGSVVDEGLWQQVDAVFAAGLIHHLQDPFAIFDLLEKYCEKMFFVCTHVAPVSDAEKESCHFSSALLDFSPRTYRSNLIDGVEFSEGADARELRGNKKRHPRSGVGNLISWWPSRQGLEKCFSVIGFDSSYVLNSDENRLRYRFVFSKGDAGNARCLVDESQFLWKKYQRPGYRQSIERSLLGDVNYLQANNIKPLLVGEKKSIDEILARLCGLGIEADSCLFDDKTKLEEMIGSGFENVIIAVDEIKSLQQIYNYLLPFVALKYAFTSFSLINMKIFADVCHPVFGNVIHINGKAEHGIY